MRAIGFWGTTVGKKFVMAVTGVIMILFLIAHLAGNLLVFGGPATIDAYARLLHTLPVFLWIARVILIIAVVLHILAALQLSARSIEARPVGYRRFHAQSATFASRTMRIGGLVIAGFIVFHILHLTTGTIQPVPFSGRDLYADIVGSFQIWWVVAIYLIALIALGAHLYHGAWGWFRTLGWSHAPDPRLRARPFAAIVSAVLWVGFTIIPLCVIFGALR